MSAPLVMVVDDDQDIREIVTEILIDAGYRVVPAKDGVDALEKLKDAPPSLILLDLNMPVMDGVEFRQIQRQDPIAGKIPTVVMSAVQAMHQRIAPLGIDAALVKPVNLKQLLATVERFCGPAPKR